MALKNLEHDGDEYFDGNFPNKDSAVKIQTSIEKHTEDFADKLKEELQRKWMDPSNPFLWDGDFDDD